MANFDFEIINYRFAMGPKMSVDGRNCYAYIEMSSQKNETLTAYFMHEGSFPPNRFTAQPLSGSIFLPAEQFPWYIDVLRNEKPLTIRLNDEKPDWHMLRSWYEPVGEGE